LKFWLTIIAIFITQAASAEIYKCRLPNDKTEISNVPCPAGSGTLTVRPDETVSESNRQQAQRDVERMRSFVEKREALHQAEEAAERQERIIRQQATVSNSPPPPPRQYGSPEECRRDIDQMVLEASQRAQREAECQGIARPQIVYVPVVVPARPRHVHSEPPPAPKKPPPNTQPMPATQVLKLPPP